ncbi:MAG TPA: malto-oligosyltrehalose trehalohydrolase [Vicinamibacterales bacterium]
MRSGDAKLRQMSHVCRRLPVGAEVQPDGGTHFRVWAPAARELTLRVCARNGVRDVGLEGEPQGYHSALVAEARAGDRYWFRLDGDELADPASRFQPEGPFGPSEIVDPRCFRWTDSAWSGIRLRGQVLYEMHVGTFTSDGTWRSAMEKLPRLAELGITTIEVMPVAEFPGRFGWGYDGVFPYAPTRLYGSPDDLRAFIDRAHSHRLGVVLDVVYNHLGPDGSVFSRFAKSYFTKRYDNEWGDALNFDGPDSAPVREYFVSNGAYWIDEFHFDGLRLDATQSIHDRSPEHIIAAITAKARAAAQPRTIVMVTENEPQNVRMLQRVEEGGYGLDAAWNDDFHHSAWVALTGRAEAYYADHRGVPQEFVSAAKYGYLFQGQWYGWQKQSRGTDARGIEPAAFVNFIENHDQLANSGNGSRLLQRTAPGRYRAMTTLLLLMPGTPMLFQGQEFGATTPFLYFADHNPELARGVEKGRVEFMAQFQSMSSPGMPRHVPPPHDPATFERSRLNWNEWQAHVEVRRLHSDLLSLRRIDRAFSQQARGAVDGAVIAPDAFVLRYATREARDERLLVVNLGRDLAASSFAEPLVAPPQGYAWRLGWSSEAPEYGGSGTPDVLHAGWRLPGHAALVLKPERTDVAHRAG